MKNKKEKHAINQDALIEQLSKESVMNWIIVEGTNRIKDGKPIGKNMTYFLQHMGII